MSPDSDSLHDRFTAVCRNYPHRPAVVDQQASLTYSELDHLSDEVAAELARQLLPTERLVGVRIGRTRHAVAGLLGVLKAGVGYVPIDPGYPAERQHYILDDSGLGLILTDGPALPGEREVGSLAGLTLVRTGSTPDHHSVPDDLCYVIYTSGSTGAPKGCLVSHHNVLSLMDGTERLFSFGPDDVWTLFHSLSFDFSVWELWGALLYGGCVVIVGREATTDPEAFLRLLVERRVTVLNQVPSVFGHLARECALSNTTLPELRYVIFGGEALITSDVRRWLSAGSAPGAELVNMYGITETTVHVTFCRVTAAMLDAVPASTTPIGVPLDHLAISLRDEAGVPVAVDVPGEMWVAGGGTAYGYLGRPELTAERFVLDATTGLARRYYRSGDWAVRAADGTYSFVGRRDGQVKLRGFRIELGEIEAAIRSFPGAAECACGVERTRSGQGLLVAYLVPAASNDPVDLDDLRAHLALTLPAHMRPQRYKWVAELPLNANGKLDRPRLAALQTATSK